MLACNARTGAPRMHVDVCICARMCVMLGVVHACVAHVYMYVIYIYIYI